MKAHEIISEAEDNDTVYKNWRKEVGTDKQTTQDIVSGKPSWKPVRNMSNDLAAMNKKLAKKEDAVSEDAEKTYAVQLLFPNAYNQRSYRTVDTFTASSPDDAERIGAEWVEQNLATMHVGRGTHMPYQVVPYRPADVDNDTEEDLIRQAKELHDVDPSFRSPNYKKMGDLEQRYHALKTIRAIKSGYYRNR